MNRRLVLLAAGYLCLLALNRSTVRVHGASMEPTYRAGDLLLTVPVCDARRGRSWLREGRVVVVEDPTSPGHLVVKRIRGVTSHGVDVRGDAPLVSTDSRTWGAIAPSAVRRSVIARLPRPRR